jgi:lipoprotein-releasing system ATP-binding protein
MNNAGAPLMIEGTDLAKVYRTPASQVTVFENLNVRIERGKLVGVIGASGAGKSTLLHLLGGLDTPTRGTVLFDGTNIFNWSAAELAHFRNSHIGFVFQFHHLLPEFTVLENAMMPMMIRGEGRKEMEQVAVGILERVGLGHRIAHQVGEISGGEQQRVAIARSLVGQPQLLLADEPTGNLDHRTGLIIFEMIRELHVERGLTSVIATHNEKIASQCDEVWELNEGVFALARL